MCVPFIAEAIVRALVTYDAGANHNLLEIELYLLSIVLLLGVRCLFRVRNVHCGAIE